jgi:hypothetical protein
MKPKDLAAIALGLASFRCGGLSGASKCPSEPMRSAVEVRFRDPRQITLASADGRVLLPAGADAIEAELQTDMPMASGHREILVLPNGTFAGFPVPLGSAAATLGFPGNLDRTNLDLTLCLWLYKVPAGYVPQLGPCEALPEWLRWNRITPAAPRFRMITPWSNVVSLQEETRDLYDNVACRAVLYPRAAQR